MLRNGFSAEFAGNLCLLLFYIINETHKQYSMSDITINYMFMLDFEANIYKQVKKTYQVSSSFAGRHAVGFGDSSIDVCLEVQKKNILKYCI